MKFDVIIVGGGLSGLCTAHFLRMRCPEKQVVILEKDSRTGGAVQTCRQEGYRAEWGPHGFLNNTAESRELLRELGLDRVALNAPLGDFKRFICHNGRLEPLPQSPAMLLRTPLLGPAAKLRLFADLWKTPMREDQTIAAWAEYRFGPGVLPMVDVAVTGTFAGDYERLSIDAVMPGVRRLEKETGSVLRGLRKKKKLGAGEKNLPAMLNFPEGMETLTTALARGKDIRKETRVSRIERVGQAWKVSSDQGDFLAPDLVLAVPVNPSLELTARLQAPPVPSIPTARIVNVSLGFSGLARIPRGFGYLAPEREKRFTLGAMFSSHMFPDRCPQGQVFLEALVGGRRHPERLKLSDRELIRRVCEDLGELMELAGPPLFSKVLRPHGGIPQLEMDHPALLAWRQEVQSSQPGLYFSGFGWDGVGMNEMIKSASKTAAALAAGGEGATGPAPVKAVYF